MVLFALTVQLSAGAFAGAWFDAGISLYDTWPTDGSDKVVESQGWWTATQLASLVDSRLRVDTGVDDTMLVFHPAVEKSTESAELIYSISSQFTACDDYPATESGFKCGVSVIADGDSRSFCGLMKDPSGSTNVWVNLAGVTPDETREVLLTIKMKQENGRSYVCYAIDGTPLTRDAETWLEIADTSDMSGSVAFRGSGVVSALSAEANAEAPAVMKALTIPALGNMTVAHVRVAGLDVAPDGEGRYVVEQGSVVTVTFAPASGWALDVTAMTFVVRDDMDLPATGRPTAINVAATVTINEVMAKNGVTLRTATGFEGLDWVELYNRSDSNVDLSGWYMGNDPTKKASKWTLIEGSCVVPAHGYKIVWFDGDGLCATWARDEAHVAANLSTDANKHTVFLASAADAKTIVQQITLPGGVKDVSYGLGHLSRTVVSATSAAEYRVGEGE